jgi:hypothetical protein
MKQTQTAKAIFTNEETIALGYRLRRALNHGLVFEQALYTMATPAAIQELESLIALAFRLHSEKLTEEEQWTRKYLHDSVRPESVLRVRI